MCLLSQLLSKVTVISFSFYTSNVQCVRQAALLLDDALKSATPLTNGAINETLTFHTVV